MILIIILNSGGHVLAIEQNGGYLNYQEPKPESSSFWSTIAYIFSFLFTFALVIGLAYLTSRFLGQKIGGLPATGENNKVRAIVPLGPNRAVYIIEAAGKFLVLGVTEQNINLLHEITSSEEIEKLKATPPLASTNNKFESVLQQHLASLQQMPYRFPNVFGNKSGEQENDREKR